MWYYFTVLISELAVNRFYTIDIVFVRDVIMRKPAVGIFVESNERVLNQEEEILVGLCYAKGADVVFFTKKDVDKDNNTINAGVWTKDGIAEETVQMPHWVECGARIGCQPFFRERSRVVDDFVLSKKDVADVMTDSPYASMVIPTMHTYKIGNILSFAMMWNEIIIKPLVGARGEGIHCVKKDSDGCFIFADTMGNEKKLSHKDSISELERLYKNYTVIVQPRMNFTNKDGQIMDFRINVEKNGEGKWQTIFMISRTSRGSIISNFSAGGYAALLEPTLANDYGDNAEKVKASLELIAREIPPFIEEKSRCNMLSLGIDVGIDRASLQPYIIEVNYVPKTTFPDKSLYLKTRAEYYAYLTKQLNQN